MKQICALSIRKSIPYTAECFFWYIAIYLQRAVGLSAFFYFPAPFDIFLHFLMIKYNCTYNKRSKSKEKECFHMKKANKGIKLSTSEPVRLPSVDRVNQIDVRLIKANISQPRQEFDVDSIIKLADSIRRYGILQPITVRRIPLGGGYCYELVAGERRLRAAKMLGLKTVPCLLSEVNEALSAELALVENVVRENLGMFEQAAAFARLSETYGLTQEEIAAKMGMSQPAVANKMRLLRLSPEERALIIEHRLTERHARAFLRLSNKATRLLAIHHTADRDLNVAETEKYVTELLSHSLGIENKPHENQKDEKTVREAVFANLDRYIDKLKNNNDWIEVDKQALDTETIITLKIKKSS